jgi:hypothetical protein
MLIIGCDFHTRYQQIAMLDDATGELTERRLEHENGEAHSFYRDLAKAGPSGCRSYGLAALVRAVAGTANTEMPA